MDFFKRAFLVMTSFTLTVFAFFGLGNINQEWLLTDVPSYKGGEYCEKLYNTGTGLESDYETEAEDSSQMALIGKTNNLDINRYVKKLKSKGYENIFENKIDKNRYFAFRNGEKQIYVYHNNSSLSARVIDDSCSDALDEFGYTFSQGEASTVYQFTFPYYDAEINANEEIYARNGMLYVIKLADNKLMIIDGGAIKQSADENIEIFMDFIREITNCREEQKIDIALWFGTHAHSDHITFISKLIKKHHNELNFERFMFNYQAYSNVKYDQRADIFRKQIKNFYPEAKYVKCRSGYCFDLANLQIEVLYTHEDFVDVTDASFTADDANDCSSVIRIYNSGKTFLFLGDANLIVQNALLSNFSAETLKSDVVQGSHHMINHIKKLYEAVRPSFVFCPQSKHRTIVTSAFSSYKTLLNYCSEENFLFADQGIYGLTPENGNITVSFIDRQCVPYDYSNM